MVSNYLDKYMVDIDATENIIFTAILFFWHVDRGMQMNSAMFTMNGHCGYVLKPEALRLGAGETCNHDKAPTFVKAYPVDVTLEVSHVIYF